MPDSNNGTQLRSQTLAQMSGSIRYISTLLLIDLCFFSEVIQSHTKSYEIKAYATTLILTIRLLSKLIHT